MKYIFIIALLLQMNLSMAQDDNEDLEDKPSWSENLPERKDAPSFELDSNVNTNIEFDREQLGMDRDDLFDDSEEDTNERPTFDLEEDSDQELTQDNNQGNQDLEDAKKVAAAEKKALEDKNLAEQALAEQALVDKAKAEKIAQEKIEQEKIAEQAKQERIAAERLAKQQAEADQLAKQKAEAEKLENTPNPVDTVSPNSNQEVISYNWVKIKDAVPEYPLRAARSGESGWVDIEIEINPNGEVISSNVVNSYRNARTFNRSAIDAVEKWEFDPPINYGIEDNQFKTFKILFKL